NEWLIEEMYEQYLHDPSSVDSAWHEFFADYKPGQASDEKSAAGRAAANQQPANQQAATATATRAGTAGGTVPSATAETTTTSQPTDGVKPSGSGENSNKSVPAGQSGTAAKPSPAEAAKAAPVKDQPAGEDVTTLRGPAAAIAKNMDQSLSVPTATSVRAVPAKLLFDNRIVINNHLKRNKGDKISFTHLIGYAMVRALRDFPNMNRHFGEDAKGKPASVTPEHVNLGLAIDQVAKDGSRNLVVASIKACEDMSFHQFWQAYEDIIRKSRNGQLTADDFAGTTISLTNPGPSGTNHSVPRLTKGQSAIIGVGAMDYPAEFQGASEKALIDMGVSKVVTLTSTYDHRVIQGAESGEFLRKMHELLLGEDGFYDDVFTSLRIPYEPVRWTQDIPEGAVDKTARVLELID